MTPQDMLLPTPQNDLVSQSHENVISLDDTIVVEDSTADSNIPPRPPNKDKYPFRFKLNTNKGGGTIGDFEIPKGISVGVAGKENRPFVGVYVLGFLADEGSEYNNFMVSYYFNSLKFAGSSNSELHSVAAKLGQPLPNSASVREIVLAMQNLFSQEPVGMAELDWRFSYENPNPITDKSDKKYGKDKYVEQCRTMSDFPKNSNGSYNHMVESKKDGDMGYAQAYIKKII